MRTRMLALLLTSNLLTLSTLAATAAADRSFTFALTADPRAHGDTWMNALQEIRDCTVNPEPPLRPASLVICAGDVDPLHARYQDFLSVFTNHASRPLFLPVIGNHDLEKRADDYEYAREKLIPTIPGVVRRTTKSCDYYLDHKSVRIICIDANDDLGHSGVINAKGRAWIEGCITAAPAAIRHVFVVSHEPAFPRVRHIGDSMDESRPERNALWQMLVKHKDRVRALLVGHTHAYYRMRVLNPESPEANDGQSFPDEAGGIYQVDAGAAGNGPKNTVVLVGISGDQVRFRVLQAEPGTARPFHVADEWECAAKRP